MSPLVFLQLLMIVSVHACNARSLAVLDKDLNIETSKGSNIVPTISKVAAQVGDYGKRKNERSGATPVTHVGSETLLNGGEGTTAVSGNKATVNSQIDVQQDVQFVQEMKMQGRSLGESKSKTTDEEAVESNENETAEDVVMMDYASPHRKPPIHNEKP